MIDFTKLLPQIEELVQYRMEEETSSRSGTHAALEVLAGLSDCWQEVARRIEHSSAAGLIAIPREALSARHGLPALPDTYRVVATDGSQIGYDRHEVARCALINTGRVRIQYGDRASVDMDAVPQLLFHTDELLEADFGDYHALSARRIATLRMKNEWQELQRLIEQAAGPVQSVAMVDGTMIPWSLEAEPNEVRDQALESFRQLLDAAHQAAIPVVGYISDPGSRDVMNLLHAQRCGIEKAPCNLRCFSQRELRQGAACEPLQDVVDAHLFRTLLEPGERSAIFCSRSRILKNLEDTNSIVFCYLRLPQEVARLEMPAWVAEREELLDRVHAIVWDQVQKGLGYPRVLTEAHEHAVVRAGDRRLFFELIGSQLAAKGIPLTRTAKAVSKVVKSV